MKKYIPHMMSTMFVGLDVLGQKQDRQESHQFGVLEKAQPQIPSSASCCPPPHVTWDKSLHLHGPLLPPP